MERGQIMVAITETIAERRLTIGEVCRELQARGKPYSPSSVRRAEERGIITPLRTPALGLRLYVPEDVDTLAAMIRSAGDTPAAA